MNTLNIKELINSHPKVKDILFKQTKENLRELQMEMVKGSIEKVEFPEIEDEVVENFLTAIAEQGIQLLIHTFDSHKVYLVPIYLFSGNWTCTIYTKDRTEYEGSDIFDSRTEAVIETFPKAFDVLEDILENNKEENNEND